jgi:hypothetical protein
MKIDNFEMDWDISDNSDHNEQTVSCKSYELKSHINTMKTYYEMIIEQKNKADEFVQNLLFSCKIDQ